MTTLTNNVKANRVWFCENTMWIGLEDGRMLSVPKSWFPKLDAATNKELENYELIGKGIGIHWEDLDEDISIENLILGHGAYNQ